MSTISSLTARRGARQFVKFSIVGGLSTGINFLIYSVLVLAGFNYLLAAVVAFLVATVNSYVFNLRWTFRAGRHRNTRLAKFVCVQAIGLTLNLLLLALLVERLGFEHHKIMAQVVSNGAVILSNFLGNKYWTFRQ